MVIHRRVFPYNSPVPIYTPGSVERGIVRVKRLVQEHNTVFPARARTRQDHSPLGRAHQAIALHTDAWKTDVNLLNRKRALGTRLHAHAHTQHACRRNKMLLGGTFWKKISILVPSATPFKTRPKKMHVQSQVWQSDWLWIRNEFSAHAPKTGLSQRSRFLVLFKRSAASEDDNVWGWKCEALIIKYILPGLRMSLMLTCDYPLVNTSLRGPWVFV